MSYMNNPNIPVTPMNGTPQVNPTPQPTQGFQQAMPFDKSQLEMIVYRVETTGKKISLEGKSEKYDEYKTDANGKWLESEIDPAEAKKGDKVVITGWFNEALKSPSEAFQAIESFNLHIPENMVIRKGDNAQPNQMLATYFGEMRAVKLAQTPHKTKGYSWLGWVADLNDSNGAKSDKPRFRTKL